jgi:hypothetical protein
MPVLSEFPCCVSAWARLLTGFGGGRVLEGTTFACERCTRVWERVQQAEGSRGRDARWMLIDEPEPELTDAQERLARAEIEMLLHESQILRLNGGEP